MPIAGTHINEETSKESEIDVIGLMCVRVDMEGTLALSAHAGTSPTWTLGLALEIYPLKRRNPGLMAPRGTLQALIPG